MESKHQNYFDNVLNFTVFLSLEFKALTHMRIFNVIVKQNRKFLSQEKLLVQLEWEC